jgi:hypothetical protein
MKQQIDEKISLQKLAGIKNTNSKLKEQKVNEIGHQANAHPWVLKVMEELRDDLNFYLDPNKQYPGFTIDFDLLKQKMAEVVKYIKKYQ